MSKIIWNFKCFGSPSMVLDSSMVLTFLLQSFTSLWRTSVYGLVLVIHMYDYLLPLMKASFGKGNIIYTWESDCFTPVIKMLLSKYLWINDLLLSYRCHLTQHSSANIFIWVERRLWRIQNGINIFWWQIWYFHYEALWD